MPGVLYAVLLMRDRVNTVEATGLCCSSHTCSPARFHTRNDATQQLLASLPSLPAQYLLPQEHLQMAQRWHTHRPRSRALQDQTLVPDEGRCCAGGRWLREEERIGDVEDPSLYSVSAAFAEEEQVGRTLEKDEGRLAHLARYPLVRSSRPIPLDPRSLPPASSSRIQTSPVVLGPCSLRDPPRSIRG